MDKSIALVIGAARDEGRAAADALARAGLHVVAVDLNPDGLERLVDAIHAAGGSAEGHAVDVSNKMAAQTMIYTVLEAHPQIDVLVCAAEIVPGTPALRMDEAEWERVFAVNLKGAFLAAQTVARAMQATGGGTILIVVRDGLSGHAAVDSARAGLAALCDALDREWRAAGVRVQAIRHGLDAGAGLATTAG